MAFSASYECRAAGIHCVFGGREGRLRQKREFHPLRFVQQITHETFPEFSERVTHTLNSFPIAKIDKTIKLKGQVFVFNKSIKWREDFISTKFVFLFFKYECYF